MPQTQRSSRYVSPVPSTTVPPQTFAGDQDYVEEAPIDNRFWGRINGVWDLAVALAGAVMQGRLYLAADPTDPMEAVTLQYHQANQGTIDGGSY